MRRAAIVAPIRTAVGKYGGSLKSMTAGDLGAIAHLQGTLYAAETATQTVAEVDFVSGTVLRRLPSGDGGDGLAVFE